MSDESIPRRPSANTCLNSLSGFETQLTNFDNQTLSSQAQEIARLRHEKRALLEDTKQRIASIDEQIGAILQQRQQLLSDIALYQS